MGIEIRKDETYEGRHGNHDYGVLEVPFAETGKISKALPVGEFTMMISASPEQPDGMGVMAFDVGPMAFYAPFSAEDLISLAEACAEMARQLRDGSWKRHYEENE